MQGRISNYGAFLRSTAPILASEISTLSVEKGEIECNAPARMCGFQQQARRKLKMDVGFALFPLSIIPKWESFWGQEGAFGE